MKFIFHPDAEVEYAEAVLYYEERMQGLGRDFTLEVEAAVAVTMIRRKAMIWRGEAATSSARLGCRPTNGWRGAVSRRIWHPPPP